MKLDLNSLSLNKIKLRVTLVNKGWLHRRLQNQLLDGTSITWENNFWYVRLTNNGGPCSDEEIDSECNNELDSDDMSF